MKQELRQSSCLDLRQVSTATLISMIDLTAGCLSALRTPDPCHLVLSLEAVFVWPTFRVSTTLLWLQILADISSIRYWSALTSKQSAILSLLPQSSPIWLGTLPLGHLVSMDHRTDCCYAFYWAKGLADCFQCAWRLAFARSWGSSRRFQALHFCSPHLMQASAPFLCLTLLQSLSPW